MTSGVLFGIAIALTVIAFNLFMWWAADWHDTAQKYALPSACVTAILVFVVAIIAIFVQANEPLPKAYEYQVRAYYLGGSEKVITVQDAEDEIGIEDFRGSYTLVTRFNRIPGVVRYEVISKREIEYPKRHDR